VHGWTIPPTFERHHRETRGKGRGRCHGAGAGLHRRPLERTEDFAVPAAGGRRIFDRSTRFVATAWTVL